MKKISVEAGPKVCASREGSSWRSWAGILVSCAGLAVGSAQAGLLEDDEARKAILDLRQRVETVRQNLETRSNEQVQKASEENAQLRRSLVELQNQIEALRADLARLRGQGEQLQRELAELQRKQPDLVSGLEERVRKLEPSKVSVDGKEFLAEPAERREFEGALALFKKGDFAGAQPAFVDFVRHFSQSEYRASALFWLGNAQYATRDYKEAIINFRALLTQYPDHARAPETLLSIANCQGELKDTKGARKTLEELLKTYPQSEAGGAAKERLARMK